MTTIQTGSSYTIKEETACSFKKGAGCFKNGGILLKPLIKLAYLFGFISILSFFLPVMLSLTVCAATIFLSLLSVITYKNKSALIALCINGLIVGLVVAGIFTFIVNFSLLD
ncbi:hypothetical protein ACX93W_06665 [Paenibacillus sp. CAU 1782]